MKNEKWNNKWDKVDLRYEKKLVKNHENLAELKRMKMNKKRGINHFNEQWRLRQ